MGKELLEIKNLHVSAGEAEILKGVDLTINKGEIHVLMGPNGAGKSTLAYAIMDHPTYEITEGDIVFEGESILDDSTDARAKKGLFLSFQSPKEVAGVSVENFLRLARLAITGENLTVIKFRELLFEKMKELNIDESYAKRYLNVGYSGGEMKKNEILQMSILNPKLAILDETDSGLDIDAVRTVSEGVSRYINDGNAVLIITHHHAILNNIKPDFVHVIIDGKIVKTGDFNLINEVEDRGFEWLKTEVSN